MPEALRKAGAFVGALCFVLGLIAVVAFLLALGERRRVEPRRDRARARRRRRSCVVPRLVSVPALLGGYSALVYLFLFFPILVVVIFAFNSGNNVAEFAGFSTKWFGRALDDESITSAIGRSLRIAARLGARGHGVRHGGGARPLAREPARAQPVRRARLPDARRAGARDRGLGADLLRQRRLRPRARDDVPRPHGVQRVAGAAHRARPLRLDGHVAGGGEPRPRRDRAGDVPADHAAAPGAGDRGRARCSRSRSPSTTS